MSRQWLALHWIKYLRLAQSYKKLSNLYIGQKIYVYTYIYHIIHSPRVIFRDNLQHSVEDFARMVAVQFTINEVMGYECPRSELTSWILTILPTCLIFYC